MRLMHPPMIGFLLTFVVSAPPVWAVDCADVDPIYRQDAEQASGINQVLPVSPEDAAIADFREFPFLDLTMNGQTTRYSTTSGGTGIRNRAAYIADQDGSTIMYATYGIANPAQDAPDHFMIIDDELYWPECPATD